MYELQPDGFVVLPEFFTTVSDAAVADNGNGLVFQEDSGAFSVSSIEES
jgi:hypothetical protein